MAIIQNIEQLEAQLEHGLGEAYKGHPFSLRPDLRLRLTGVCAVTSIAIQEILRQRDIASTVVLSKPQFPFDREMDHVFVVTEDDTVIDGSYSQFVEYGGILPYDIERGDAENLYPERKVAQFQLGHEKGVVTALTQSVLKALTLEVYFDHLDRRHFSKPEFYGRSEEEISTILREIWLPENFVAFEATPRTIEAGIRMAQGVLEEEARLVA